MDATTMTLIIVGIIVGIITIAALVFLIIGLDKVPSHSNITVRAQSEMSALNQDARNAGEAMIREAQKHHYNSPWR